MFIFNGDEEVIYDWPAGGEHFSVILEFLGEVTPGGDAQAKVDFFARQDVAQYLDNGVRFFFMAGRQVLAEAEITAVLWSPEQ